MPQNKKVVNKFIPYPIPLNLVMGGQPKPASIIKLTSKGIIFEVNELLLRPQQSSEFEFTIPVVNVPINGKALIVKVFDRVIVDSETGKSGVKRLAEAHFRNLDERSIAQIRNFLLQIDQEEV